MAWGYGRTVGTKLVDSVDKEEEANGIEEEETETGSNKRKERHKRSQDQSNKKQKNKKEGERRNAHRQIVIIGPQKDKDKTVKQAKNAAHTPEKTSKHHEETTADGQDVKTTEAPVSSTGREKRKTRAS